MDSSGREALTGGQARPGKHGASWTLPKSGGGARARQLHLQLNAARVVPAFSSLRVKA